MVFCSGCRAARDGYDAIRRVLQRDDLGDGRHRAFWHALAAVHGKKGLVDEIPNMPCTVTVTKMKDEGEGHMKGEMKAGLPKPGLRCPEQEAAPQNAETFQFQFAGAPCHMRPLLKEMVRFERPFITWDIWKEPPPLTFPSVARPTAAASSSAREPPQAGRAQDPPNAQPPLRDPAKVNKVRHLGNATQYDADRKRLVAEDWAGSGGDDLDTSPVEAVQPVKDGLFIVHAPADGELQLGLVRIMSTSLQARDDPDANESNVPHVEAVWFQRAGTSKKSFKWPETPTFKWWPKPKGKSVKKPQTFWIRADSLLVRVKPTDLTDTTKEDEVRLVQPRLRKTFMEKLKAMAKQRQLLAEEPDSEDDEADGDDDEEGDEGEDEEACGEDDEDHSSDAEVLVAADEDGKGDGKGDEGQEHEKDDQGDREDAAAGGTSASAASDPMHTLQELLASKRARHKAEAAERTTVERAMAAQMDVGIRIHPALGSAASRSSGDAGAPAKPHMDQSGSLPQVGPREPTLCQEIDLDEEYEVQGCSAKCTVPCMDGCKWERCTVVKVEPKHYTVRMADDGEEIRVIKAYVRAVSTTHDSSDLPGQRSSRRRRLS